VFIDCELIKILGRIMEVKIPDGERLSVEPTLGASPDPNPVGRIQLLASMEPGSSRLQRGIKSHPRIGDSVFLADPELFADLVASSTGDPGDVTIDLGTLDAAGGCPIRLSAEKFFGRHCGVLGATGGGKSWTIATLLLEIKKAGGKAILFDPTGEFAGVSGISSHYTFNDAEPSAELVHFPYQHATEDDLFVLFRPSGQSQGPKLRDAIKSLKLVAATKPHVPPGVTIQNGNLIKRLQARQPFFAAVDTHKDAVHGQYCQFDIFNLPQQIAEECIWSSGQGANADNWGNAENGALSYCESLVSRMRTQIHAHELSCLFAANGKSAVDVLESFFATEADDIIRFSFQHVRFEHFTREILMNVIGRYVLNRARSGLFKSRPLIVILDEAHQFLGRAIGDEYSSVRLESFGLIAKEGRKYGLTCVLATQRPRDIPADVLSQLGTLIVHRLTNDHDREVVEKACGDLDRNAAIFIPTLAPGEAIVIGPDIPAPVPLSIRPPTTPPDSQGPPYNKYWTARRLAKEKLTTSGKLS
jgi:hypothetical protein